MNFEDAHKQVDAWLTEEGVRGRKGEAETDASLRRAIEKVLEFALNRADPMHTCMHCAADIEQTADGEAWVDKGTVSLVFCTDQDETHDSVRHAPS